MKFSIFCVVVVFFIIIFSSCSAIAQVLIPSPNSPVIPSSSNVFASFQCSKNSDESYAVCASDSNLAIKYNLQPFSYATKGPPPLSTMRSCDLYETTSQSSSTAICVQGRTPPAAGMIYFYRVSDMTVNATLAVGLTSNVPHIIVDTPNQVAYASNLHDSPPAMFKITNIGSASPIFAATLTPFGVGDINPAAMLIIEGFVYVHFYMNPGRLGRINISTFTWNETVKFTTGELDGYNDNIANDDNYIYVLTQNGILVRCTYKNNNFSRLDSLDTGFSHKWSLSVSPNRRTLFIAAQQDSMLQMVDTGSFTMFGNTVAVPATIGRPIITSTCNVYAFCQYTASVYWFRLNSSHACRTPTASLSPPLTASSSVQPTMTWSSSTSVSTDLTSSISHDSTITRSPPSVSNDSTTTKTAPSVSLSFLGTYSVDNSKTQTQSSDATTSQSATPESTLSFSSSKSQSRIPPPPPYISPLRDVYEAMATTSSFLSVATMSSANVLGAVRARSAVKHGADILSGACDLDEDTLSDLEDNPDDVSSSPTQLKIRKNYLVGQVIGNIIVILSVGVLWVGGYVTIHGREKKEKEIKQEIEHDGNKHKKHKYNKKSFEELIVDSNAHGLMLFFAFLLLEPTLAASATLLISGFVVDGRSVTIWSIICVILGWFILLVVAIGWSLWKFVLRRDSKKDEFELVDGKENRNKSMFRRFIEFTTSPLGEWRYSGDKPRKQLQFELARPFIESFTDRFPKFIIIDIGVIVALSLAEIIPQMFPGDTVYCFAGGVVACFVFSLHVLLVVYYRPLYTDRLSNTLGCLVDILSVAAVAGAMKMRSSGEQDDADQIESWSRLAVAQSVIQMVMTVLQVIEVLFPLWDGGVELVKKQFCSSKSNKNSGGDSKQQKKHGRRVNADLTQLMNQDEQDGSSSFSPLLHEMAVISQPKKGKLVTKRKLIGSKLPKRESSIADDRLIKP